MEPADTPPKPRRGREIMQYLISICLKRGHMRNGCGVIIPDTHTVIAIVAKTLTAVVSKTFRLSNFCYDSVLHIIRVICSATHTFGGFCGRRQQKWKGLTENEVGINT